MWKSYEEKPKLFELIYIKEDIGFIYPAQLILMTEHPIQQGRNIPFLVIFSDKEIYGYGHFRRFVDWDNFGGQWCKQSEL